MTNVYCSISRKNCFSLSGFLFWTIISNTLRAGDPSCVTLIRVFESCCKFQSCAGAKSLIQVIMKLSFNYCMVGIESDILPKFTVQVPGQSSAQRLEYPILSFYCQFKILGCEIT